MAGPQEPVAVEKVPTPRLPSASGVIATTSTSTTDIPTAPSATDLLLHSSIRPKPPHPFFRTLRFALGAITTAAVACLLAGPDNVSTWLIIAIVVTITNFIIINAALCRYYPVREKGIILITGASTGIGKHAAVYLASKGYCIFAGVRTQHHMEMYDVIRREENIEVYGIKLDVTVEEQVKSAREQMAQECQQRKLPFVALVNNAGVAKEELPMEYQDMKEVSGIYHVNVFGPMALTNALLPLIREHKSRIINVSSGMAIMAVAGHGPYNSSKAAFEAYSDILRQEVQPHGVSVSVIQPAIVESAIHNKQQHQPSHDSSPEFVAAKGLYPWVYAPGKQERKARYVRKASPALVSSLAIYHSITDAYPKTRYPCANTDGIPFTIMKALRTLLSDRLADFLEDNWHSTPLISPYLQCHN